ncbi:type II toxin-antitoxin system Phd/YefM family antitoxin [Blastococcus sp. Marseille-P5729]|uniref:type II toxin-antitoxin system Phd/YefM family antitoxin n=1 Tax=Blastococcus sp. Marseille-P5729 TaxID=2086582 RepID=UPI0018FEFDE9|nr:type II toxin-antitoxin system prevent-host-death family antitoxin [Blastococcus sp. Marseille-P5729]
MKSVNIRTLRNNGAQVLARVERGESLVVTRDGTEVAELRPRTRPSPSPADLIERRRHLPRVDPEGFRRDVDEVLDPSL